MTFLARSPRLAAIALVAIALGAAPSAAQEPPDSARVVADTAAVRAELRPPLSPRRAFLYSLLLPGYAQSVLGRNRAGALQVAFEAAALVMLRISAADLREARHFRADSIPVSFVSASGAPAIRWERTPFNEGLVRARRAHVEDWIAVVAANHLFSALDAYVASQLWDLPAEVAVRATPRSAGLALQLSW